jgi:hypothetical protein
LAAFAYYSMIALRVVLERGAALPVNFISILGQKGAEQRQKRAEGAEEGRRGQKRAEGGRAGRRGQSGQKGAEGGRRGRAGRRVTNGRRGQNVSMAEQRQNSGRTAAERWQNSGRLTNRQNGIEK